MDVEVLMTDRTVLWVAHLGRQPLLLSVDAAISDLAGQQA
jgi:hypothetical protein